MRTKGGAGPDGGDEALLTTKDGRKGILVLGSGATSGEGSLEALDALQEERVLAFGKADMKRSERKSTLFRCGKGEAHEPIGDV